MVYTHTRARARAHTHAQRGTHTYAHGRARAHAHAHTHISRCQLAVAEQIFSTRAVSNTSSSPTNLLSPPFSLRL